MNNNMMPPPREFPQGYIDLGMETPYDGMTPITIEDIAANAVIATLETRRGVKEALQMVPQNLRGEILEDLAVVIRSCLANAEGELEGEM